MATRSSILERRGQTGLSKLRAASTAVRLNPSPLRSAKAGSPVIAFGKVLPTPKSPVRQSVALP